MRRSGFLALVLLPLGAPWAVRSVDAASRACSSLFERPYVRYPDEPVFDPVRLGRLIENTRRSVAEVWAPAVESGVLADDYERVIREQQAILTAGYDGYVRRIDRGVVSVMTRESGAGKFVTEFPGLPDAPIAELNLLELPDARIKLADRADKFEGYRKASRPIRIEWMPEDHLPSIAWSNNHQLLFLHIYPKRRHLGAYLHRMREFAKLLVTEAGPAHLRYLSDYYHVAINSHVFRAGNNSLFMSHVNFFLERRGLRPIPHGNLDFSALTLDYDEFRAAFFRAVRAENPSLHALE